MDGSSIPQLLNRLPLHLQRRSAGVEPIVIMGFSCPKIYWNGYGSVLSTAENSRLGPRSNLATKIEAAKAGYQLLLR
jgi:hypothetical protein